MIASTVAVSIVRELLSSADGPRAWLESNRSACPGIDSDELPLPLKSSSLWDNDWDLKSDWYEWEVIRPEL